MASSSQNLALSTAMASSSQNLSMAERLWSECKYERTQALYTPFVVCLASGSLQLEIFLNYIAQEAIILQAFAQAYQVAKESADVDDMKVEIWKLCKSIPEKLKLHESILKMYGTDWTKESMLNLATFKYIALLMATASGEVEAVIAPGKLAYTPFEKTKLAASILGAIAPRMGLYAFLGKALQSLLDPKNGTHPNQKWIDYLSSDYFQAEAIQTELLLEKLSVSLTRKELDTIEKLYHKVVKLEVDFLKAQPLVQKTILPLSKAHRPAIHRIILYTAFDFTCTVSDSATTLIELSVLASEKSGQTQLEDRFDRVLSFNLTSRWDGLSDKYTEEYEKCMASILVGDRVEKFDEVGLSTAIQKISVIQKSANLSVSACQVLKGLNVEDIRRAGERLVLQDGCMEFFHSAVNNENFSTNIHVISYCWSGDLIRSTFASGGVDSLNIHANDLIYKNSIATGEVIGNVGSAVDKVVTFATILQNCSKDRRNVTVYIGDSIGDLLCLIHADIGIVIGSNINLRKLCVHFGVTFVPLHSHVVEDQRRCFQQIRPDLKCRKILYTASSWAEIHGFILGW